MEDSYDFIVIVAATQLCEEHWGLKGSHLEAYIGYHNKITL